MNWLKELSDNKALEVLISNFLTKYGIEGLEEAIHFYENLQQEYTCRTKTTSIRIRMNDIYYLKIKGHHIIVHTAHGDIKKYGSLNNELKELSHYGFVKCNQSCLVSLSKIKFINNNDIILSNSEVIQMSKNYAPKVIIAFHHNVC